MKILVLCDDRWHPASTIRQGLAALREAGVMRDSNLPPPADFHFDWIENAQEWSAERMADYDVTIFTKSNNVSATDESHWMIDEVAAAFVDFVRSGKGLLVIHSGSAGYSETPALRQLMGGVFVQHPPQCRVTVECVEGHPLTIDRTRDDPGSTRRTVPAFEVQDEHYFMTLEENMPVDIFLTTTSEHSTQPGGWRRTEGSGRVCMLTPGHNLDVWLHPRFQSLLYNALCWCGKIE